MTTSVTALDDPSRLDSLRRARLLDTPPEEAFDRFTRLAAHILGAPTALVSLIDRDRQFFKSAVGLGEPLASLRQSPLSHSYCKHVVDSGEPLVVEDAREHPLTSASPAIGDYGAIAYCGIPIVDRHRHRLGALCVIDSHPRRWSDEQITLLTDLAQGVIAEIDLRLVAAELDDANQALHGFISVTSHDINNPVTSITGMAHVLRTRSDRIDSVTKREFLAAIEKQGHFIGRLVSDLLTASKLETAAVEAKPQAVELAAALSDVREVFPERTAELTVDCPLGVAVRCDPDHLHRMLVNLVSNAFKYGAPPVELRAVPHEDGLAVSVSDHGHGVKDEFVPRLFERFARCDSARAAGHPGSGLGLFIVKGLAEMNGASVRYEPRGDGARFLVRLRAA